MKYYLKTKVDVIKYDGTNKDFIIKKLNINNYIDLYFKEIPTYFIIQESEFDDWFILNEKQFKDKIISYE